jgi:hypothetical protein
MTYTAQKQLCLNADRTRIVPCDSPDAAMTLALPGVELPDEVAKQYGLLEDKDENKKAVDEAPQNKAVNAAPANKQRKGK